jgi:hypothetical protein
MKYQKGQGDIGTIIFFAVLLILGIWVYSFIKAAANVLHIEWSSAAILIFGLALIAAANVYTLFTSWHGLSRLVLPASFPLAFFALWPALKDWANNSGGFPSFSGYQYRLSPAWYGTWWGGILIFSALCGIGWIAYKWLDDRY